MTAIEEHPLWRSRELQLVCERSSAGHTVEVLDDTGVLLANCDDAGKISDATGELLLHVPLVWDRNPPARIGTDAKLQVEDHRGERLGEVHVKAYSVTPRSSKATLVLWDASEEVARVEARDGKGEELAITLAGEVVGSLRRTARKRRLLRSTSVWKLEWTASVRAHARTLLVASSIRYPKLLAEVATASRHR